MERHWVHRLLTVVEHPEKVAELFSALSTERRVRTYTQLYDGVPPKEIAAELDVKRPTLQPYLNDFKATGLMTVEGNEYVFTEKGEQIYRLVENVDALNKDLSRLQEFLVENPEVVPPEVLEEVERRNGETTDMDNVNESG